MTITIPEPLLWSCIGGVVWPLGLACVVKLVQLVREARQGGGDG